MHKSQLVGNTVRSTFEGGSYGILIVAEFFSNTEFFASKVQSHPKGKYLLPFLSPFC